MPVNGRRQVHRLVGELILDIDLERGALSGRVNMTIDDACGRLHTGVPTMSGPGKVPPAKTELRGTPSGEMTLFTIGRFAAGPITWRAAAARISAETARKE